ncbi:sorting nexin-30-like [Belonocnema kinseyi]|uniref:sorting nexin-30-like n=1 Tax=Belonocnema kinseyi TaxID=2817044 RepID=UPI00143CD6B3|nr:sorting nexin-30-like [Belonocnema kinseyi]XP_033223634.1 sorting nexin-30-like [Belonocnema kinseyi]XP_033223635.1 sorting nexin-30-like [Belonocnema kinseyi]
MMTSENDIEDIEEICDKKQSESAVLEVSSTATGGNIKQENPEVDFLSSYSTSMEGSVVASPSVDSFSTLPDQEMSDFQLDSRDLQVKVDNPQKHVETLETYITFCITTKSTRPEYNEGEYVVRRRYNDFIWLRQKLVETYPTHIIPPMPGKHSLLAQLDRYSKEFIIARMKLLHVFLNRIVNHPILSCDKSLHIFLTCKPAEFSVHRKNRGNVLVKVTDSLPNITSVYSMKLRNLEFEQIREYCFSLSEKLATMDKISHRIYKERQDYLMELHQLHPIFTLWATTEPELAPILLAMAKAIETNAHAHQKLLDSVPCEEKEYVAYIESVKDALNRRDTMQVEYEMTVDDLAKRRLEKDQLANTTTTPQQSQGWGGSIWKSETRDEKLEKLGQVIPRLVNGVEVLQDRMECANENLHSDLDRWNVEKRTDLKNMLITMADQQISHYQQCMTAWEDILAGFKLDGVVSEGSAVKILP